MVRVREMVGETDKTDSGGGGRRKRSAEEQPKSWESLAVICVSVPVSGSVHNRYDVKQRTNVVLCDADHPPCHQH